MNREQKIARRAVIMDKYEHDRGSVTAAEKAEFSKLEKELYGKRDAPDTRSYGSGARTKQDDDFTSYLRRGEVAPSLREVRAVSNSEGTQPGQVGGAGGTAGGYMVAQAFWENLQVALKAYGGMSKDFRHIETDTGAVMPWPTINPTTVVGTLLSEGTQLAVDTGSYVFGQGVLNAWTYTTNNAILVSRQLVNDSEFDVDSFLTERIGEQIGRAVAAAAISGTGSSQPLGIYTALAATSAAGTVGGAITATGGFLNLATAASVKTFAAPTGATELAGNVLSPATCLGMVSAVDPAYYQTEDGSGCKWYMNNAMALNQHGVIDSNGRPLLNFEEGFEDGAIGRMLGFPVVVDNGLSNLTASTVSGPIFGNLDHAMVKRTVRDAGVLRLSERYADFLAYGYIGYVRTDIRSNDLRAAVVCKPAAT